MNFDPPVKRALSHENLSMRSYATAQSSLDPPPLSNITPSPTQFLKGGDEAQYSEAP